MEIEELNISLNAKKFLKRLNITDVSGLLKIDYGQLQKIVAKSTLNRSYFDEIFEEVKRKGLSFAFEQDYYLVLASNASDLASIAIDDLILTPDLRKYLNNYNNLQEFFTDIADDTLFEESLSKKHLKRFLTTNIKSAKNYEWLDELLKHLGNNGTLLALLIKKYQAFLEQEKIDFNSLLNKVIDDNRCVAALNRQDIYFLGDLVKCDEETMEFMDGIGPKSLELIKNTLAKYGLKFNMRPAGYFDFAFKLSKLDIEVLNLGRDLETRLRDLGINNLNDLMVKEYASYFTSYDIKKIIQSYKDLGFSLDKTFLPSVFNGTYAKANEWILELKTLRERYSELIAQLYKNNSFIATTFPLQIPIFNEKDYLALQAKKTITQSGAIENLDLPVKIKDYLARYGTLEFFFYKISSRVTSLEEEKDLELNKFLFDNIKPGQNYENVINTLANFGNDGVVLAHLIRKYQDFLQTGKINLNTPIDMVFTDSKLIATLAAHNIYFLGDLVKLDTSDLKTFDGIDLLSIEKVDTTLANYGYHLGMPLQDYFNFTFSLGALDIKMLKLNRDLEMKLRNNDINNLNDLVTSSKFKAFSPEEMATIMQSYRNLGFATEKGFMNSAVNNSYTDTNKWLIEIELLILRYNELIIKLYKDGNFQSINDSRLSSDLGSNFRETNTSYKI